MLHSCESPNDVAPAPLSRMARLKSEIAIMPVVGLGLSLCACAAVTLADPTEQQLTPVCPLQQAVGWWCPFCGATRATAMLFSARFSEAIRYNAFWMAFIPLLGVVWLTVALPRRNRWLNPIRQYPVELAFAFAFAAVSWTVLRNTMVGSELWLRYPGA